MGAWSWTIRGVWRGIISLLVCLSFPSPLMPLYYILQIHPRLFPPFFNHFPSSISQNPTAKKTSRRKLTHIHVYYQSERTFLAWLRTSLAFASIGVAITQLFRLNTTIEKHQGNVPDNPPGVAHLRQVGKPLGATFLGISILVLLVGGRRYFESQYWIIRGKFPASRGSVFLVTAVAAALIVTSLVVVCVVDPGVFEKR